jgi:hypothetical protein
MSTSAGKSGILNRFFGSGYRLAKNTTSGKVKNKRALLN